MHNPVRWIDSTGLNASERHRDLMEKSGSLCDDTDDISQEIITGGRAGRGQQPSGTLAGADTAILSFAMAKKVALIPVVGLVAAAALAVYGLSHVVPPPGTPVTPNHANLGLGNVKASAGDASAFIISTLASSTTSIAGWEQYRFFMASANRDNIVVPFGPLTFEGAQNYVMSIPGRSSQRSNPQPRGVLALTEQDALNLVNTLGGPVRVAEIEKGGGQGYFWHFHPADAEHVHIWFIR